MLMFLYPTTSLYRQFAVPVQFSWLVTDVWVFSSNDTFILNFSKIQYAWLDLKGESNFVSDDVGS